MIDAGFSCRFLCDADRLGAAVPSMDGKRFLFHPGDDLVNDLFIEIHVMDREVENGKDPGFHEAGSTPGRPERSFNDDRSRAAEGVEQGGKGARFVGKLAPLGAIEEGKGEVFSEKASSDPPVSSLVVALTAEIDEPRRPIFFKWTWKMRSPSSRSTFGLRPSKCSRIRSTIASLSRSAPKFECFR